MLKRTLTALVGVVLIWAGLASPSTAAADVPSLSIGTIGYNARGADTMTNRNSEYVDIANTSPAAVDVKGLLVQDSWAHGKGDKAGECNNYTVESLPGVTAGADGAVMLESGHVIRVYSGSGTPRTFGPAGKWHAVYMASECGYNGHFWNNLGDTAWISLSGASEFKRYDFRFGYYVR